MKTTTFVLKNGLKVILIPSHKAPVISVQSWVRTGSADEPKGDEGISHFIEHLVFKGSRDFGPGEIATLVEASGGELNAYTSFDQTVFYVTISSKKSETALHVVSQMMGFPLFDAKEIDLERDVVIEEIKRGQDSLSRRGSELLFQTHFKKHPYGRPVIGYEKNIRAWPAKHIQKYYQERYSPQNMFLIVAGDFTVAEMKKKVEEFFGPIPKFSVRKSPKILWKPEDKGTVAVQGSNFQQRLFYFAWPAPAIHHKDVAGLDALTMIWGQGDSSRLVKKMRIERPLAQSIGSSFYSPKAAGLLMASMVAQPEQLQEALEEFQHQLLKIVFEPVTTEELQKVVRNIESDDLTSRETVDGLSRKFGSLEFYFKDLKAQEKYLKALRQLTPAKLQLLAKKYLKPNLLRITSVVPTAEAAATTQTLKKFQRQIEKSFQQVSTQKASNRKPKWDRPVRLKSSGQSAPVEVITLRDGTTVFLKPIPETALVSVRASFLGGSRADSADQLGRSELLGRSWMGGTPNRDENSIAVQTESLAAGLYPVVGKNTFGLALDVLANHQKAARDIFLDVLCEPKFPEDVLQRERTFVQQQIHNRKDSPAQIGFLLANQNLFPNHPYGQDPLGTERTLNGIHSAEVRSLWSQVAQRKNLWITLCGQFDRDAWLKEIENRIKNFSTGSRWSMPMKPSSLKESKQVYEHSQKAQSHVILNYRGLALTDPERDALQVLQSVLAGQGGRLFLELRDKASLAYSVSPIKMEGLETGSFGAYIGCSPEKVPKAIEMMKWEFDKLCQTRVDDGELARSKNYLAGHADIDLQRTSSVANSIQYAGIYGLPPEDAFQFAQRVQNVTAEQVQKLAQRIFSQPAVTVVVGPENPF